MKILHLNLIILLSTLLLSCSTTNKNPIIKGSNYVSMKPGLTYHYKRTALKSGKTIYIDITIDSCNKDRTECKYFTKVKNAKGKIKEKYFMKYSLELGNVYLTDRLYPYGTLLLPARMRLNDEISLSDTDKYGQIHERLIAHKIVPKININKHEYKNCVDIIFETITPAKTLDIKLITGEISCENIGTVRKEMQMSYSSKVSKRGVQTIDSHIEEGFRPGFYKPFGNKTKINLKRFIPIDTYLDTLQSITQN